MIKYSLYTEDKGNLGKLVSKYFDSFTIVPVVGFWKGKDEKSVIIEVFTNMVGLFPTIKLLGEEIKKENNQESVLLSVQNVLNSTLI